MVETIDWPSLLAEHEGYRRQRHAMVMPAGVAYEPPPPGASEASLAAVEAHLGHPLEPQHRALLANADGWTAFTGTISLLGTADLLGGPGLAQGRKLLKIISMRALGPWWWKRGRLLPIAVSDCTLDVLCMEVVRRQVRPQVIWFNNTEPDDYPSLEDLVRKLISWAPAPIATPR